MKESTAPQGDFIKQLKAARTTKTPRKKFDWTQDVSGKPQAQPASGALDGPAAKPSKTTLTDDLPHNSSGNLDMAQMRSDLVSQMKRNRRKTGA